MICPTPDKESQLAQLKEWVEGERKIALLAISPSAKSRHLYNASQLQRQIDSIERGQNERESR